MESAHATHDTEPLVLLRTTTARLRTLAPSSQPAPAVLLLLSLLGTLWTAGHLWHAAHVQRTLGSALSAANLEVRELRLARCELPLPLNADLEPDVLRLEQRVRDQGVQLQQLERALRAERARGASLLGAKASAAALRASSPQPGTRPLAFVAVFSHPSRMALRNALRESWFPTDDERARLEREEGLHFRFVLGKAPPDAAVGAFSAADAVRLHEVREQAVQAEAETYGDILLLTGFEESAGALASKTLLAMEAATVSHDAAYFVKVDDDTWLSPAALAAALRQRQHMERVYLGCMRAGSPARYSGGALAHLSLGQGLVFSDPEPSVLPYAAGQAYALSADLVLHLVSSAHALRTAGKEDVTVGAWLFGLEHSAVDDARFCCAGCGLEEQACVAIAQAECSGVCDPERTIPKLQLLCNASGKDIAAAWAQSARLLREAAAADAAMRAGREGGALQAGDLHVTQ